MNKNLLLKKFKKNFLSYRLIILALLSFLIPFILYLLTLERKVLGGDTTWYALQIPQMYVLVPTGYPTFSLIGKLISMIPIGDLAYRLNLFSAIFGALTILFIFLALNKLIKNEIISLAGSLIFAFTLTFWTVANRLEFDTLNSFFIAMLIYSLLLYNEKKLRRQLYFCFFCLGLSLTNHPIAFFIAPAFLSYIIIVQPRILKSIRTIFLSLLFFLIPLISYIYILIRSLQGFGPVTSLQKFIYYVTGRNIAGEFHGGFYESTNLQNVLKVIYDFLNIIYRNFGIILIIFAGIGFIYLIKKNLKFAVISLLVIVLSITITSLYLSWTPENYAIDSMIIITFYISSGFKFIYDELLMLLSRVQKRIQIRKALQDEKIQHRFNIQKYLTATVIILFFILQPAFLAASNFTQADHSKPEDIYLFWNKIFNTVEKNSIIYVNSTSLNIGAFIDEYEQKDKNIEFIVPGDSGYTVEGVKDNLHRGRKIYFVNVKESMKSFFNFEKIDSYHWPRFEENIIFYKLVSEKLSLKIQYQISSREIKSGEKFTVLYRVINENNKDLTIASLELSLPKNIIFLGVSKQEDITDSPGLGQGKYMWVKEYKIKAESQLSIGIELQAESPGQSVIKFAATSQNIYMNSEDLNIIVRD
ncbi:MAG: DUF2723 domain-containing protein [Actinobacteria bacterium]|nr:DUF2723 domain-containing protein [Actinomycetota bacterium]